MIKKQTYPIIGMHCASCKTLIEKSLAKKDGVKVATVNFATEKLTIEYDDTKLSLEQIKETVSNAGPYKIVSSEDGDVLSAPNANKDDEATNLKRKAYERLRTRVQVVFLMSIPFIFMMGSMLLSFVGIKIHFELPHILQFVLSSIILFWGGKDFFSSAMSAFKSKTFNMDSLVVLGTMSAWIYSTYITFLGNDGPVFFEASVFIILFILLGRLLEARSKSQANDAINSLIKLQPTTANVIRGGKEVSVDVADIVVGDVVIVRPGEKIASDGEIIEGKTSIDESMITGESIPVTKVMGDSVIGATINKSSTFKYKTTVVGADTMLSQIIQMVEDAGGSRAEIQNLADKVSSIFVPVVIAIALAAFSFWYFVAPGMGLIIASETTSLSVYVMVTVFIIACPCALGLATPTALIVGIGKAAKKGILIKDAQSVQNMEGVRAIVFDKTGTLTEGKPTVEEFVTNKKETKKILNLAYSLEDLSEHPLSNAIAEYALGKSAKKTKISGFKNIEGKGVLGKSGSSEVFIGNKKLMVEKKVKLDDFYDNKLQEYSDMGKTVTIMAIRGEVHALFVISDQVRKDSKAAIKKINSLGIKTIMLTGDNEKTAKNVAESIGIKEYIAEVLPGDKLDVIKKKKKSMDGLVAMVGDGINDAPALAESDVGIAMGTGTDVAIESGDVVLVGGTLDKVYDLLTISRFTMKIVKQNLFWAFAYNTIAIPISAGLLYPFSGILLSPIIASFAMAMSSVSVVTNSLRIKRV